MAQRIFIAEQNLDLMHDFKVKLETAEFEVLTAENGKEVIERLSKKAAPKVILLNSNLEEVNTVEVCNHIKQNLKMKNVPILVFLEKDADKQPFIDAGVKEFMTKPFFLRNLLKKVYLLFKYGRTANIPNQPDIQKSPFVIIFLFCFLLLGVLVGVMIASFFYSG